MNSRRSSTFQDEEETEEFLIIFAFENQKSGQLICFFFSLFCLLKDVGYLHSLDRIKTILKLPLFYVKIECIIPKVPKINPSIMNISLQLSERKGYLTPTSYTITIRLGTN